MQPTRKLAWLVVLVVASAGFAAIEACVGDDSTGVPDASDAAPDTTTQPDGGSEAGDAAADVNTNCDDASGAFVAAVAFPINGRSQGATVLAGSGDLVLVGEHASPGLLGPDAGVGPSNGQSDALVFRRTAGGAVVWAKSFGGAAPDEIMGVASDSKGDVYVVGDFNSSSISFDSVPITNAAAPNTLPVVAKLSGADGTVVWAHAFSPANADSFCGAVAIRNDHLAVGCKFSVATSLPLTDGGTTSISPLGGVNGLVVDLDLATGGVLWATPFGAYVSDAGTAVAKINALDVTSQGDVIACGTYSGANLQDKPGGNATFTLTRVSSAQDGFVAELSPLNGNAQWAKGFAGASANSQVDDVNCASDGTTGVLLEGAYQGQLDLGAGPTTSNGSSDVFIASLKSKAGAPAWQKSFGSTGLDLAQGIAIDDCARPIAAVRVSGALTLDGVALPAPQANGYAEAALKLDGTGKLLWANGPTPPSTAFLSIQQIVLNANNGRTLVTGYFGGTVDLGGGNTATNNASGPFFIAYSP